MGWGGHVSIKGYTYVRGEVLDDDAVGKIASAKVAHHC